MTVVRDVGFDLPAGGALCLVGENGAGKSTVLRCVTGLTDPSAGRVRVFGAAPDGSAAFWRRVVATVEQPSWYAGLTVREHVELVRLAGGADPADGRVDELLSVLGLRDLGDGTPDRLSSGERQRLLLAAALARPAELLVLDEPEQRLDAAIRPVVAGLLGDHLAAGGSLLFASHDPVFVAALDCPVLRLHTGSPAPDAGTWSPAPNPGTWSPAPDAGT
ncbi:ATP-binding cassette domain-containing protein [Micromonospora sp. NPDC002389]|uniref:ABC transporter ATP-binding protein n=1 Tax=Micromonospora sp. NPDC002389 TaxID=3154272 RepID=UPI0033263DCD